MFLLKLGFPKILNLMSLVLKTIIIIINRYDKDNTGGGVLIVIYNRFFSRLIQLLNIIR